MPPKFACSSCSKRLRRDGSCPSEGCPHFRAPQLKRRNHSKDVCGGCSHTVRFDGTCSTEQCVHFKPSCRTYSKWRKETVAHWKAITPKRTSTSPRAVGSREASKTAVAIRIQSPAVLKCGPVPQDSVACASCPPTAIAATSELQPSQRHLGQAATGLPFISAAAATQVRMSPLSSQHRSIAAFISRPSLMESCCKEMGAVVSHSVMSTAHAILERCAVVPEGPADHVGAALLGVAAALSCPTFIIVGRNNVEHDSSSAWRVWLEQTAGIEHIQDVLRLQPRWLMVLPFACELRG